MSEQPAIWEVATIVDEEQLQIALGAGWEPFAAYPITNTLVQGLKQMKTVFVLRRLVTKEPT